MLDCSIGLACGTLDVDLEDAMLIGMTGAEVGPVEEITGIEACPEYPIGTWCAPPGCELMVGAAALTTGVIGAEEAVDSFGGSAGGCDGSGGTGLFVRDVCLLPVLPFPGVEDGEEPLEAGGVRFLSCTVGTSTEEANVDANVLLEDDEDAAEEEEEEEGDAVGFSVEERDSSSISESLESNSVLTLGGGV